jgi:two-component system chemotaxis response regulator CheB
MKYEAIVIGVSAGGLEALQTVLTPLPANFGLPLIIIQHMHPYSDNYLVHFLNEHCQLGVKEAEEKERIAPGTIYIAPPNYHLLLELDRSFSLSVSEKVNHARPSIDVTFETAADIYGSRLIGIILTGANNDGSLGLKQIKQHGGLTIVQDPKTAEVDSMPRAAIAATVVDHLLPLPKIGTFLIELIA